MREREGRGGGGAFEEDSSGISRFLSLLFFFSMPLPLRAQIYRDRGIFVIWSQRQCIDYKLGPCHVMPSSGWWPLFKSKGSGSCGVIYSIVCPTNLHQGSKVYAPITGGRGAPNYHYVSLYVKVGRRKLEIGWGGQWQWDGSTTVCVFQ